MSLEIIIFGKIHKATLFGIFLLFFPSISATAPLAKNALLDLRNWDFKKQGAVELSGQWEFYWKKFIVSDKREKENGGLNSIIEKSQYIKVPSSWNHFKVKNKKIDHDGFASYKLNLLLPSHEYPLALKYLEIGTAYRLYANQKLILQSGTPGKNREQSKTQYKTGVLILDRSLYPGNSLELVVEVANFHHIWGGMWNPILLGDFQRISQIREKNLFLEFIVFGVFIFMTLYQFLIYVFYPKDRSLMFFALFALLMAVRAVLTGEKYVLNLADNLSWEWMYKFEYLTVYLGAAVWAEFIQYFFSTLFPRIFMIYVRITALILLVIVIFFPVIIYARLLFFVQINIIILSLYSIYKLIRLSLKNEPDSRLFLIGWLLFFITIINDILYTNEIIESFRLFSIGLLLFSIVQTIIISIRLYRSFETVEFLAQQQESKVRERTKELESEKERAEKANRAKSDFLSIISHELRTPLNAILGSIDLLSEEMEKDKKNKVFISVLKNSGSNLLFLIEQLLDLARIEKGKLRIKSDTFRFYESIDYVFKTMESKAKEKNLIFNLEADENIKGIFHGPRERIEQILFNVMGNAIKFTLEGKVSLKINLEKREGNICWIQFSVADTGIGIKDKPEKIFDKFSQVDSSLNRTFQGSGLGLAITKDIVDKIGGKIWFESELNTGSTFYILIPIEQAHFDNEKDQSIDMAFFQNRNVFYESQNSDKDKASHILVAEDNSDNYKLLEAYLLKRHYNLTWVKNGADAFKQFKEKEFDLIIMDIQMPIMDGYEATTLIRNYEDSFKLQAIPILALSANASEKDIEMSKKIGCNLHLVKPIKKELLLKTVSELLNS